MQRWLRAWCTCAYFVIKLKPSIWRESVGQGGAQTQLVTPNAGARVSRVPERKVSAVLFLHGFAVLKMGVPACSKSALLKSGTPLKQDIFITYDRLNRLKTGTSTQGNNESVSYDLMGNITALSRYQASAIVDNLSYTYGSTNQLQSVADGTSSTFGMVPGTTNYPPRWCARVARSQTYLFVSCMAHKRSRSPTCTNFATRSRFNVQKNDSKGLQPEF